MTPRERVSALVDHPYFQRFIVTVIGINAALLAVQTSASLERHYHDLIAALDTMALAIFVVELALKLYAQRSAFFRDPWNVFDFAIVAIALIPASGPFAVLRALRVLRVLRLVSAVPPLRRVVSAFLRAIPGMVSIIALATLVIFVAGVMGTALFAEASPHYFGDLGRSLFSLFQTMTGESWPDIAEEVMAAQPLAWIFFVVYILVSSFAVLNLFIAVVVNEMEQEVRADIRAEEQQH
ncbi:MAG: ion transporter, partial [Thermocrispum agreste]